MKRKNDSMMLSVNDDLLDDSVAEHEVLILEIFDDSVDDLLILISEICFDESFEDDLDDEVQKFVNEKI